MNSNQFKQANVVGVINRANEMLESIRSLGVSRDSQEKLLAMMKVDAVAGDHYELASIALVEVELVEGWICNEDRSVERQPDGWAGGFTMGA
jgi:hypothetical protein